MDLFQALGLVIMILYACGEGFSHAILYSRQGADSFPWNEHWVFIFCRAMVVFALMLPGAALSVVPGFLVFPFFHNGMYYTQRDRIDNSYPKRWWDMTRGSSAKTNLTPVQRTILFALGIITFILIQIFNDKIHAAGW